MGRASQDKRKRKVESEATTAPRSSDAWYIAEGKRGQQLLAAREVGAATLVFESILARLGRSPTYARAVVLGQLGRCLHLGGLIDLAAARLREAMAIAGALVGSSEVTGLRASLLSELGHALTAAGQRNEARGAHEAALALAEELHDARARGIELSHLAALDLADGRASAASARYAQALAMFRQAREPALEAHTLHQLSGSVAHLAAVFRDQPGRLGEARQLAMQALSIARQLEPAGEQVWRVHGLLAEIDDREASAVSTGDERRAVLLAQARAHRHLARLAPRILASARSLGAAPSFGRAVILGGLGRCFLAAGRADLAAERLRESVRVSKTLEDDSEEMKGLRSALHLQLGEVLVNLGQRADAEKTFERALELAKELRDLHGQGVALCHLAAMASARGAGHEAQDRGRAALAAFRQLRTPELEALALDRLARVGPPHAFESDTNNDSPHPPRHGNGFAGFETTIFDHVTVEYAFEPDLLLDGRQERHVNRPAGTRESLKDDAFAMLLPGSRSFVDDEGSVRFALPAAEPALERRTGCIVMRRQAREVAVAGASGVLWKLVRALDGTATAGEVISGLQAVDHTLARRLLAALVDTGVVDVSGRPFGRYLHAATKKGVLPGGRLQDEQVRQLVADGRYRTYDDSPSLTLGSDVPERIRPFHTLTRARRSRRGYTGGEVSRLDFDALLDTACGVTGTMPWSGHELRMRAYPSSGALYAVEIYPVVWRVEGVEPGVYHFRATGNALERVRTNIDIARLVAAALPVEREMVGGAATMVCLTGHFSRHEHKYGQGGYRMLVAEAGHISQNLVLAATALGLAARPFGGVFDDLVNEDLGLDNEQEQFLLAVLIGHAEAEQ